jgi:hypothetical protein
VCLWLSSKSPSLANFNKVGIADASDGASLEFSCLVTLLNRNSEANKLTASVLGMHFESTPSKSSFPYQPKSEPKDDVVSLMNWSKPE